MNRMEQSDLVRAEVDKLIERDIKNKFATVPECVASWACEVTDKLGFPIIVIPVWSPPNVWTVVSYAIPSPQPDVDTLVSRKDQPMAGEDRLDVIDEGLLMLGCSGCLSAAEERLRQICCELSAELRRVRNGTKFCHYCEGFVPTGGDPCKVCGLVAPSGSVDR